MSNTLYNQIRLSWDYPVQPTSLQVGDVINLLVKDVVSNISIPTSVIIGKVE